MSKARKLAWIRFLAFCVGLFFPLLVFAVVRIVNAILPDPDPNCDPLNVIVSP